MIQDKLGQELLFFDGGMWTSLRKVGLELDGISEVFNFEHPERVEAVHRGYLEAGANIITTNTFGANRYRIKPTIYTVDEVIRQAVEIAKKAKEGFDSTYIALDIGSTGKRPMPNGDTEISELYDVFKEQAIAGEKYGCNIILLETFTDLDELKVAILAVKENTKLPAFATMSFRMDGKTFCGTSIEDMVVATQELGVDAIGMNCVASSTQLIPIVKKLLELTKLPVIVQPNAGVPVSMNGESVYTITSQEFAEIARELARIGVSVLGGCCGSDEEYIRNMIYNCKTV